MKPNPSKRVALVGNALKRTARKDYYACVRVDSLDIRVGEAIELQNEDERQLPYIAEVESIFTDVKGKITVVADSEHDSKIYVRCRWYYRPNDLLLSASERRRIPQNELFLVVQGSDNNLVESIVDMVSVRRLNISQWQRNLGGVVPAVETADKRRLSKYFCREMYDPAHKKFIDLEKLGPRRPKPMALMKEKDLSELYQKIVDKGSRAGKNVTNLRPKIDSPTTKQAYTESRKLGQSTSEFEKSTNTLFNTRPMRELSSEEGEAIVEAASPELIEKTGIASQKERDTEQPKSLMSQASSRNDGVVKALNGFSKIAIDVQMLKLADSPDGKWLKDLVQRAKKGLMQRECRVDWNLSNEEPGSSQARCLHYLGYEAERERFLAVYKPGVGYIRIGDSAYFANQNSEAPCYIGRIVGISRKLRPAGVPSDIFVLCQWFYRPDETDLPHLSSQQTIELGLSDVRSNEVFLSTITDENHLDTIVKRCEVVYLEDVDTRERKKIQAELSWKNLQETTSKNPDRLYFRYMYDPMLSQRGDVPKLFLMYDNLFSLCQARWNKVELMRKRKRGPPTEMNPVSSKVSKTYHDEDDSLHEISSIESLSSEEYSD